MFPRLSSLDRLRMQERCVNNTKSASRSASAWTAPLDWLVVLDFMTVRLWWWFMVHRMPSSCKTNDIPEFINFPSLNLKKFKQTCFSRVFRALQPMCLTDFYHFCGQNPRISAPGKPGSRCPGTGFAGVSSGRLSLGSRRTTTTSSRTGVPLRISAAM